MQMQARQRTGLDAKPSELRGVPGFPVFADVMVPHIRRIADEGGHAGATRQLDFAVVLHQNLGPVGPAPCAQVGSQHQCGQRVHLDGYQLGSGEGLACREDEAARTRSRVDDASRRTLRG